MTRFGATMEKGLACLRGAWVGGGGGGNSMLGERARWRFDEEEKEEEEDVVTGDDLEEAKEEMVEEEELEGEGGEEGRGRRGRLAGGESGWEGPLCLFMVEDSKRGGVNLLALRIGPEFLYVEKG